jgi:hypothetical protein
MRFTLGIGMSGTHRTEVLPSLGSWV